MLARREVCLRALTCAHDWRNCSSGRRANNSDRQLKLFLSVATEMCGHPKFT